MTSGLRRGSVALRAHDAVWTQDFGAEQAVLADIFRTHAIAIEHVGSTAVPGLSAKPSIDIAVGLKVFARWSQFTQQLEAVGYAFMPERVRDVEVFMPKGPEAKRTHYLHITQFGGQEWDNLLAFRDKLRANAQLSQEYEQLKQALAQQFPDDRKAYSAGKHAFIERNIAI